MIYGARIKQVREVNGWTQASLADLLNVTQSFVAQVESNWSKPPQEFMTKLVFRSGFPMSFFEMPVEIDFPFGSLLFRAHSEMTDRDQKLVHRHAQMAYEIVRRMLTNRRVREVQNRVPRFPGDPEQAANLTRSECGLSSDEPVRHVIYAMEAAGVLVVALPREFPKGDAFSAWAFADETTRRPIVVLSANRPADRIRMSAAHELGHLVMHQPVTASASEMEDQAKAFASAFLLPAGAMRQELVGPITLESFVNMKVRWGVSIQALIVRAHELDLVTGRKYRTLFQQLSAKGWRLHEPLSSRVPLERPRAIRQIAELLYGKKINYTKLASDVQYPESFIRELLDAHASKAPLLETSSARSSNGHGTTIQFKVRKRR